MTADMAKIVKKVPNDSLPSRLAKVKSATKLNGRISAVPIALNTLLRTIRASASLPSGLPGGLVVEWVGSGMFTLAAGSPTVLTLRRSVLLNQLM